MTAIWGVLNTTPDSFSDGGRYTNVEAAVAQAHRLHRDGAAVIDVGGESTRPGAERVPAEEEQRRVIDVVTALSEQGMVVSIDTMRASTAQAAVRAGATYVNDVSGGLADPEMLAAVAEMSARFVLGHWRGPSADMYEKATYSHIGRDVASELLTRVGAVQAAGISPERIVVDPGVGFAKAGDQNWQLLRALSEITGLGFPVLVGTSRKRFLRDRLAQNAPSGEVSEEELDLATAVTSVLAAQQGAWAVRVHNVAATQQALNVAGAWQGGAYG